MWTISIFPRQGPSRKMGVSRSIKWQYNTRWKTYFPDINIIVHKLKLHSEYQNISSLFNRKKPNFERPEKFYKEGEPRSLGHVRDITTVSRQRLSIWRPSVLEPHQSLGTVTPYILGVSLWNFLSNSWVDTLSLRAYPYVTVFGLQWSQINWCIAMKHCWPRLIIMVFFYWRRNIVQRY